MNYKQALIRKLFDEHMVKIAGDDGETLENQNPAFECVVILEGGVQISGVLSRVYLRIPASERRLEQVIPVGLKMLMPPQPHPRKQGETCMPEMVFAEEDVLAISVLRDVEVSTAPSPIIRLS